MFEVISAVCVVYGMAGEPISRCWMYREEIEQAFRTEAECLQFAAWREDTLQQNVYEQTQRPPVVKVVCAFTGEAS